MAARKITMAPTISQLPMPEKSRLEMVAIVAMAANTTAVPPKADMIRLPPFEKPSIEPIRRDSIRPMKKVKPSSRTTPSRDVLGTCSMPYMKPKAIARKAIRPMNGLPAKKLKPVVTPIQAPRTVGIMDRASSQ